MNTKTNTTTKHTPGPWKIKWETTLAPPIIFSEYRSIAEVYGDGAKMREANARLIAAAPELLAALKALLPLGEQVTHWTPEFDAGEEAVKKAEGI